MTRLDWHSYFLAIADTVSQRADCTRSKVGAVLVSSDHRVLSTGYNGTPPGSNLSCLQGDCPRGRYQDTKPDDFSSYDTGPGACIALHAEQNAILWSSPEQRKGATLYITREPCAGCQRLIEGVGIIRVVTPGGIRSWSS